MNIVLDSFTGSLLRSLEQRTHVDVEAAVGITCSHHFGTTVVTVLTHLGNEDTRTATFLLSEFIGQLASQLEVAVVL